MTGLLDVEFYRDQGYVLARDVFDADEVATLQREIDALFARAEAAGRSVEATWRGQWREAAGVGSATATAAATKVDSIHYLQNHSALFTRTLVDPRLVDRAAELIGPNIQLHHTKLHNKPPAVGSPFPMHQDYPYFPHEADSMIAAVIHVDDANVENGCLCVVPGSHKLGPIEHRHEGSFYLPLDEWPLERALAVEANAGDVLFFGYCMVHGSYVNRSQRSRRILLVQMRSPTDHPLNEAHRSPGQGTMLRGINPDASQI
jgi:ectoine hydroxylase-related dioxygenase (phytanoyl-CoA dioxygenase family)